MLCDPFACYTSQMKQPEKGKEKKPNFIAVLHMYKSNARCLYVSFLFTPFSIYCLAILFSICTLCLPVSTILVRSLNFFFHFNVHYWFWPKPNISNKYTNEQKREREREKINIEKQHTHSTPAGYYFWHDRLKQPYL